MQVISPDDLHADAGSSVCITGHRISKIRPFRDDKAYSWITAETVRLMLNRYIEMAYDHGYTGFFSGLATGVDLWAAGHVLDMRDSGKNIRLYGAMPFLKHARHHHGDWLELLRRAEYGADSVVCTCSDPEAVYMSSGPNSSLYRDRNYFMVEHSHAVIAFMDESAVRSGTGQTISYAKRRGRNVYMFSLDEVHRLIDDAGTDIRSIESAVGEMFDVFELGF